MFHQANKSVMHLNLLRNEYGTASNIKSNVTRKNVLDAITKAQQKLKLFKDPGEKGIVIFTGALLGEGDAPGTERMEAYVIVPPEPIKIFLYRCDSRFHTEYLAGNACGKKKLTAFCLWMLITLRLQRSG